MDNFIKQVLSSIWQKTSTERTCSFKEITGHNDIKNILNKALFSKRPVHILFVGKPGSAKTMFLTEIMQQYPKTSYFVVGGNTTKAGLVNQLFESRPRYLLIDELDKMNYNDQTALLHLMETGIISETKIRKTRQMNLESWVFATANSCEKIIGPLVSRFVVLEVPEYTFWEFAEISVTRLSKEGVDERIARIIAEKVWNELDSRDIRDVVKVGRLASNLQEISFIVGMMKN
jgi:Holliday junction DNA helicase RuvB